MDINVKLKRTGNIRLGDTIDISDPSYGRDVWCRMNDVKIVPGTYICGVWHPELSHPDHRRIFIIGIYLEDMPIDMTKAEKIGDIGVDAGLAGFLKPDACYTKQEWYDFCDSFKANDNVVLEENRFFCSSGYGDGCYPVYARENADGIIDALEIRF